MLLDEVQDEVEGPSNGGSPARRSSGSEIRNASAAARADASVDASSAAATAQLCGSWASRERSPRRISGELQLHRADLVHAAGRDGAGLRGPSCTSASTSPGRASSASRRSRIRSCSARAARAASSCSRRSRSRPCGSSGHPADRLGRARHLVQVDPHTSGSPGSWRRLRCGSVTIPMTFFVVDSALSPRSMVFP